jgi:group II intron reverse transcriptase/maturase
MLEERVDDRALIQLIKKWLRAGILEEDGRVVHPATGTPQGGIVSPVLSNIYLHYVLDLWFEKEVARGCLGQCKLVRYADDFVGAFESRWEAEAFEAKLKERLAKFELEVAEEKTQTLKFTKRGGKENGKFDFLGFEFRWGVSRKGNDVVMRRTSRKRLQASLRKFTEWARSQCHQKVRVVLAKLKRKFIGYGNYYAVAGNARSMKDFYWQARKILFKWLNRRSQRRSYSWAAFNRLLRRHGISHPKVKRTGDTQLELGLNVVVL